MSKVIFTILLLPSLAFGQNFPNFPIPVVPDHIMTPGDWNKPPTPLVVLCDEKHHPTKQRRHVTASQKLRVLYDYGIDLSGLTNDQKKAFRKTVELDDLVSIELDGINDEANLWPQSRITPTHNAHQKDLLENRLHAMVCANKISLQDAQTAVRTDWWTAYQKYIGQ